MTLNDTVSGLAGLLTLQDFSPVYREADRVRREAVGDVVHIRAILEFSNHCRRQCPLLRAQQQERGLRPLPHDAGGDG